MKRFEAIGERCEREQEAFDLEKIRIELLLERKELEDYKFFKKISLVGLWISFLLTALEVM